MVRFVSFNALGEYAERVYASSPTTQNAVFLSTLLPIRTYITGLYVYLQVVHLAVYLYFAFAIIGNQGIQT